MTHDRKYDELKACPHCDGPAGIMKAHGVFQAFCADRECISIKTYETAEAAAAAWNTRTAEPPAQPSGDMATALAHTIMFIEHSIHGAHDPSRNITFRSGISDLELTPEGNYKLSQARATLTGRTHPQAADRLNELKKRVDRAKPDSDVV